MTQTKSDKRNRIIITAAVFSILAVAMFSAAMNRPLSHDEFMYISAGVMVKNHALYSDFAYLQMPYLPIIYGAVYKLTGTSYYLLWGRICSFIFISLAAILIYLVSYRLTENRFVAIVSTLFFAWCHPVIHVMSLSWNHVLPITFSLLAFYLFIRNFNDRRINVTLVLIAGLSLGLAVGVKLTYAVMLMPFLIIIIFYSGNTTLSTRFGRIFLPFTAGILIGLLPAIIVLAHVGTDRFVFNNLEYHQLNTLWRSITGYTTGMSLAGKIKHYWQEISYPSNLVIFIPALYTFTCLISDKALNKETLRQFTDRRTSLCILIIGLTSAACFIPTPVFISYLAMPMPFVIIFISFCYNIIAVRNRLSIRNLLICLLAINCVFGGARLFKYLPKLFDIENWTTISVHRTAGEIRRQIEQNKSDDSNPRVATLMPVYVLESGLNIYVELATGPFLYRVADLLSDEDKKNYKATSPELLHSLLTQHPPAAILTGYDRMFDQPFVSFAEGNGYEIIDKYFDKLTLYILPE